MGVSKNRGTPKSSILIGFSLINHPFLGTPILETHIYSKSFPKQHLIHFQVLEVDERFTSPRAVSGGWLHQAANDDSSTQREKFGSKDVQFLAVYFER